jgi:hypothetical protein
MDVIEVYLAPTEDMRKIDRMIEKIGLLMGFPYKRILRINHIENAFGAHGYRP